MAGHSAPTARLAARLAQRELRRHPVRTLLVVTLVWVPTLAMTLGVTFIRTDHWSAGARQAALYGQADEIAQPLVSVTSSTGAVSPVIVNGAVATVGGVNAAPTTVTPAQLAALRRSLPAGSRTVAVMTEPHRLSVGYHRAGVTVSDLPLADPIERGKFGHLRGRRPRSRGEVVLSTTVADDLGVGVGAHLRFAALGRSLRVVGIVVEWAGDDTAYVIGPIPHPQGVEVSIDRPDVAVPSAGNRPVPTSPHVQGLEIEPAIALGDGGQAQALDWTFVAGTIGLAVLGTIVVAAFAVGARRQLRSIGLLAATGASPESVRWFLVAQGVLAGVLGSLAGVASGIVIAHLVSGRELQRLAGRPLPHVVTDPFDLVVIVGLGTFVAAAASWLPARTAARAPVLQSLAGRRPVGRVPAFVPIAGALAVLAGCGLLAASVSSHGSEGRRQVEGVVGGPAVLFGAIALIPWVIVGVERASRHWPASWRLAGRSVARSRARSSAVAGAVCAVVGLVVVISCVSFSVREEPSDPGRPIPANQVVVGIGVGDRPSGAVRSATLPPSLRRQVLSLLPAARVTEVRVLDTTVPVGSGRTVTPALADVPASSRAASWTSGVMYSYGRSLAGTQLAVATPALLDFFRVPPELRAQLRHGHAIAVGHLTGRILQVELQPSSSIELGGSFDSPTASNRLPGVLVAPATARRLHLTPDAGLTVVFSQAKGLSRGQRIALGALGDDLSWQSLNRPGHDQAVPVDIDYRSSSRHLTVAQMEALLLAGALVLVLAVMAVGLALAAQDTEDERSVLAAVGAPPRLLRRVGAVRSVLVVAVAVAVAVPAGLLAAATLVWSTSSDIGELGHHLRIDWWGLGVVLAAPALAGVVTWGGAAVRDRFRPAQPEVFVFAD